ncbi:MAG: aminotransferase class I/II-fold pyridoxal phosphate-dependent enzyme [Gammaproteobacteria bacterium]|nr:aminotransferase class I/II-fold pyridoxal phosphate-dependent enzyme [Gammaproteobacteria bacterium]MYF66605.1 aminotransferase class I/II-fold pyridoxal phosphate-dependent enzyme [Gammaproteobacteria bacterium]MYK37083.1 aminotransferase class I/II-fold pyridoxal phosphate-dependent enzyme [Gammaproteobacteria bacterium]
MSAAIRRAIREALREREKAGLLRSLETAPGGIDFCSNDYLGLARDRRLRRRIAALAADGAAPQGATGSRLISGNHPEIEALEDRLAGFYSSEAALVFSSGFAANLGLLASLGGLVQTLICDRLLHASAIDGGRLSGAKRVIFAHNDMRDLNARLGEMHSGETAAVAVDTVYSMDGDFAPLEEIADLAEEHDAAVVVDEAHANGVLGPAGRGGAVAAGLQDRVLARVVTFGKALGLQGGAVLCSKDLRDYLVNFARSFIFSTGVSPLWAASVRTVYELLPELNAEREQLLGNVSYFRERVAESAQPWLPSESWIQCLRVPGARRITRVGGIVRSRGLAALPIRAPTVPAGEERIRVCLHAYNTREEIDLLFSAVDEALR